MDFYEDLSDFELRQRLIKHGVNPGPITGTTRNLYVSKLQKLDNPSPSPVNRSKNYQTPSPKKAKEKPRSVTPKSKIIDDSEYRENIPLGHDEDKKPTRPIWHSKAPESPQNINSTFQSKRVPWKDLEWMYDTVDPSDNSGTSRTWRKPFSEVDNGLPKPNPEKMTATSVQTTSEPFACYTGSPVSARVFNEQIKKKTTNNPSSGLAKRMFSSRLLMILLYFIFVPLIIAFVYPFIWDILDGFKRLVPHFKLILTAFLSTILVIYIIRRLYIRRKVQKLVRIREKYKYVDRVLDLLQQRLRDFNKGKVDSPYLPILHVRELLFPPSERGDMYQIWNDVVEFIRTNESRIRTEVQRISGQDFHVWKWIGCPLMEESEPSPHKSSNTDLTNPKIYNSLTPYLRIRFEQAQLPTFEEVANSLIQTAKVFGAVIVGSIMLTSQNCIYLKMSNKDEAIKIYNRFNNSSLHGRHVDVRFISDTRYEKRLNANN